MAYPPKIKQLCNDLTEYISANFSLGDKIPGETELSKIMCCSSRTLGTALRKLASEGIVQRNNRGTFVSKHVNTCDDEPLTVLLPCADFEMKQSMLTSYANRCIIDAAVQIALKHNRRIVTVPITESNNAVDISINRMSYLTENSMVMFSSCWFKALFPLFEERNCRIAFFNSGEYTQTDSPNVSSCYKLYVGYVTDAFFSEGISYLKSCGAKNILCAVVENEFMHIDDAKAFFSGERETFSGGAVLFAFDKKKSIYEWMTKLAHELKKGQYDALLMSPGQNDFFDRDFYDYLNIPVSFPVVSTESMFFKQKRFADNAKFIHMSLFDYYLEGAEFLLSGKKGKINVCAKYKIFDMFNF